MRTVSLTEGSIVRGSLLFTVPLILGNLFQQLYSATDSLVVGNFVGSGALAAVSASNQIVNLVIGFVIGLTTGAGIVIAAFSTIFGFAMIWHIWWLAIVGFAGMIITWIVKSFDEDVDYYVPVAEIEKLENQHFDEITKAGLKNGN